MEQVMAERSGTRQRPASLLKPGHNCWRIDPAERVAFLIDGAAYFAALRNAIQQARHTIYILGWDIDSRMRLERDTPNDPDPVELGEFLNSVVSRRRHLHAYVLAWDFAMIYALDREWLPIYRLGWSTHRRVHFHLDDYHPPGGSHHQKMVVIDDRLAFVGGLDLTRNRWDTPAHRPSDPRRVNPDGQAYRPFHDIQVALSGPVAAALGEYARERWRRASGHRARRAAHQTTHTPWPQGLEPDLQDVPVAIARTQPKFKAQPAAQEIKHLWIDGIRATQRFFYAENQYLTADCIRHAIETRMRAADCPEFVIVQPKRTDGWLSQQTMDVLRGRLVRQLREIDGHNRFQVYYPDAPKLGEQGIVVHSKLMIVDDELVRIGSSNLNNRSMGLDTECDIAIEARGNARVRDAIAKLRYRLLGEHLGVSPQRVQQTEAESHSLIDTIEHLRSDGRSLRPLDVDKAKDQEPLFHELEVVDPEQPIDPDQLASRFVPPDSRGAAGTRLLLWSAFLLILLGLAAAWRWTPLGQWLDMDLLVQTATQLRDSPAAPIYVLGGYLLAGLLVMPITVLIAATVLTFGTGLGLAYALAGSLLSALFLYGLGRKLGRAAVRRLAGPRLNRLSQRLAKRGLLAIIFVRVVPVAPFTVVNLVAGASHIRFAHYLWGTVIGMFPGIFAVTAFIDRLYAIVKQPDWQTVGLFAAVAVLIIAVAVALRRWLVRRAQPGETVTDS